MAVSALGGWSPTKLVFLTPLWFGIGQSVVVSCMRACPRVAHIVLEPPNNRQLTSTTPGRRTSLAVERAKPSSAVPSSPVRPHSTFSEAQCHKQPTTDT